MGWVEIYAINILQVTVIVKVFYLQLITTKFEKCSPIQVSEYRDEIIWILVGLWYFRDEGIGYTGLLDRCF